MREEEARARIERRDGSHVRIRELEIEHGDVLRHALLLHRLGNDNDVALQKIAKRDLRHRLALCRGDLL